MPFGLAAAPSTFQKLINQVVQIANTNGIEAYYDDILVHSKSIKEHMKLLSLLFKELANAGLKLAPEKCQLFKREIQYLGHIITKNGISVDKKKIEAINEMEPPQCRKRLQSFLGMCGYYRRFIKNYGEIVMPLEALLARTSSELKKKRNDFIWTEQCNEAFKNLKSHLIQTPVLTFPDPMKTFILDTDTSFD